MKIPSTAPVEIQQAFREVWSVLDRFAGSRNIDLAGRRVINAGSSTGAFDYATKFDVERAADVVEAEAGHASDRERNVTIFDGPVYFKLFRAGSIPFIGVAGLFSEDRSNLYWDRANHRLGLGLDSPQFRLHLRSTATPVAAMDAYAVAPTLLGRRAEGTVAAPTAVQANQDLTVLAGTGYGASAFGVEQVKVSLRAAENWTATAQGTLIDFATTTKLGTTMASRAQILDDGRVKFLYQVNLADGLVTAPAIAFTSALTTGLYWISGTSFGLATNGVLRYSIADTGLTSTVVASLTTPAEAWVGPSTTAGIYFKSSNAGFGFTSPLSKVSIDGGLHVGGASDAGDNNALIDGTLGVTGAVTHSSTTVLTGNILSDLLFTDATYDIGKSGVTRPRDGFFSRDLAAAGTITATGAVTGSNLSGTNTGDNAANSWASPVAGSSSLTTVGTIGSGVWNAGSVTVTTTEVGPDSPGLWIKHSQTTTGGDQQLATFRWTGSYNGLGANGFYFYVNKDGAVPISIMRAGGTATNNMVLRVGAYDALTLTGAAGTATMSAYGAGTATFDASGNITSVSDARYKDRIAPLPYGLTEVLRLRPVQHGYNTLSGLERDHLYGGFLAQDVRDVMPIAVGVDARGYLTLADRPILGAVVNAVQELDRRMRACESRLAA